MVVTGDTSRELQDHLSTIQGNILHGYRSARAEYVFYEVTDAAGGRAFLSTLVPHIKTAASAPEVEGTDAIVLLNVAITSAGLRALDVDPELIEQLPHSFTQPIAERAAALLDDRGVSDPSGWEKGLGDGTAHILVMRNQVVATRESGLGPDEVESHRQAFENERAELEAWAQANGLVEVHQQPAELLAFRREHFGWADGLSQPAVKGVDSAKGAGGGSPVVDKRGTPDWRAIEAGEFIHGYRDEDGLVTTGPTADLLLDGTYMVYRKLHQDVAAFRGRFQADANAYRDHHHPHLDDVDAYENFAAKVVGRWRDGKAIMQFPVPRQTGYLGDAEDDAPTNDFRYWGDHDGAVCPLGAHVRRTNPRDALGWQGGGQMSERHRIIRRGMPYGPFRPWNADDTGPDDIERGLIFICFNADIERQFEVVQRQWCNDGNLFGLADEKDYLLGDHLDEECGDDGRARSGYLTIPASDRPPHFVDVGPPVVWTKGCEYLLVPGMDALRRLASGRFGADVDSPAESDDIARVVELAKADLARSNPPGTTPVGRDQHPRAHGLVRARFVVAHDLPPELRVGIFRDPGRTYDAWIRFSSRAGGPRATDAKRDAHGMAIKLLGVGHGATTTQDFVLVNSPAFFCRDAKEYVELATKAANGSLLRFFVSLDPRRWRLRALVNLARAVLQKVDSPLDIRYWSQTPSRLGPRAVKYSAAPVAAARVSRKFPKSAERIGDAMADQLTAAEATFDFMVQLQGDPVAMPIEDPTIRWDESVSPFVRVARIHIPAQDFRSSSRRKLAEDLSFTPWHSLPEHRPLGSINRVRRAVYAAISEERHARNGVSEQEPTSLEDD